MVVGCTFCTGMFLSEMFHEVCAQIPTGTEPAAGSEETAVAHRKGSDKGTHTLAVASSESDLLSTCATPFVLSEGLPLDPKGHGGVTP